MGFNGLSHLQSNQIKNRTTMSSANYFVNNNAVLTRNSNLQQENNDNIRNSVIKLNFNKNILLNEQNKKNKDSWNVDLFKSKESAESFSFRED